MRYEKVSDKTRHLLVFAQHFISMLLEIHHTSLMIYSDTVSGATLSGGSTTRVAP